MRPRVRLLLCGILIIFSAVYAALINLSPELARTVALGYIGVILTIYLFMIIWRKS